ncbi:MAG: hypothetical protein ACFBSD_07085, partial [Paracoccaceae bacterium]
MKLDLQTIGAWFGGLGASLGGYAADPLIGAGIGTILLYWAVRLQLDSALGVERLRALLGDKALRRRRDYRWWPSLVNETYHRVLGCALERIDSALIPDIDPDAERARRAAENPFGWPLFKLCLLLGFLYPIGFMALQWLAGFEARIGTTVILPEDAPVWTRLCLGLALALLAVQWIFKMGLPNPARRA